ncbi:MAG: hypothetical protein AAB844_00840 [Patescibacteria group bacterium]
MIQFDAPAFRLIDQEEDDADEAETYDACGEGDTLDDDEKLEDDDTADQGGY